MELLAHIITAMMPVVYFFAGAWVWGRASVHKPLLPAVKVPEMFKSKNGEEPQQDRPKAAGRMF